MTKKMISEGVDLLDAKEVVEQLMNEGHKITINPFNGKIWIFDHGIPRK
jgi:hypothetical protein